MDPHDAARIEGILAARNVPEPYASTLRAAGCGDLADDSRLSLTLLWIAADDLTSFGALNHSMGGTVGIASGRIRDFVNTLRVGGYLAVDRDYGRWDHGFALTEHGAFAAEILRSARRVN